MGGAGSWLLEHGDLGRVFLVGDSAGGNIVHNVVMMAGKEGGDTAARIEGAVLLHASFGGRQAVDGESAEIIALTEKLWPLVCPGATDGPDDPRMNLITTRATSLNHLACKRLLVCEAEGDHMRPRARVYYEAVMASGWGGTAEWFESKGEDHVFFLNKPGYPESVTLMDRLVAFFAGN